MWVCDRRPAGTLVPWVQCSEYEWHPKQSEARWGLGARRGQAEKMLSLGVQESGSWVHRQI